MAEKETSKTRTLCVAKYLMEHTDEQHSVSARDIEDYLAEMGISAERRTIYRDIATLRDQLGMDIDGGQGSRYRLLSRQFEPDDIRLLAECVHAAKFISNEQAELLIDTLCDTLSIYQADALKREVYFHDRVKSTQKGTLGIISTIRTAIGGRYTRRHLISFKYMTHRIQNGITLEEKHGGKVYKVVPGELLINDGNYYLLALDAETQERRTYRIDRMRQVEMLEESGIYHSRRWYQNRHDNYTKRVFSMFGGQKERVSIQMDNALLDTAVDKFGTDTDVFYRPEGENEFVVTLELEVSEQFFAWVFGFGQRAKIVAPKSVVKQFQDYLKGVASQYGK